MPLKYNVNEKYKTEKKKHIKKNFNGQTNIVDKYTNIRMYKRYNQLCKIYKKNIQTTYRQDLVYVYIFHDYLHIF